MRIIEMATRVDMSAQQYWALRLDVHFDEFCAERDSSRFTLTSQTEGSDAEGNAMVETKGVLTSSENLLPTSLQSMLGAAATLALLLFHSRCLLPHPL